MVVVDTLHSALAGPGAQRTFDGCWWVDRKQRRAPFFLFMSIRLLVLWRTVQMKHVVTHVKNQTGLRSALSSHVKPTALGLVRAVQTVPLAIAEELCRQAATLVVTVVKAALSLLRTRLFIRMVLTLRNAIAHLVLVYAFLPVGTLELFWRRNLTEAELWIWPTLITANCQYSSAKLTKSLYLFQLGVPKNWKCSVLCGLMGGAEEIREIWYFKCYWMYHTGKIVFWLHSVLRVLIAIEHKTLLFKQIQSIFEFDSVTLILKLWHLLMIKLGFLSIT